MTERQYINYRKLKAFGNRLCFYLCRVFPIKRNLISVCTFEGKGGFGCNPKYVVMELHRQHPEYEFVWFVNDMDKEFPDYIKKVPNTLWSRAYWLSRSKVWIDNYRKPYGTTKRKGQYYLNVNHYTIGIKCTGLWRGDGFSEMAYLVSKNDSDMIDDLVIDSKWCEVVSPKGLVYNGTYLKTGAPRCDILYGDRTQQKLAFRRKHGIPDNAKVVMYAPTFREGAKDGKRFVFSEIWSIDFKRLLANLEKKFGGDWYLCVRVHPQLAPTFEDYHDSELKGRIINESQADDMYEILAGMDVYITDYSSACFEAGFTGMPVFLYADDVQKYANARGQLMWNLATDSRHAVGNNKEITSAFDLIMPFSLAHNNQELEEDILKFDPMVYGKNLDEMYEQMGLAFSGEASNKIAAVIEHFLKAR
ncbi:CDP-glycerol glycerophosphotransferase family protein [Pseudobutyrivibrio ruminis]|uniref:CDP-glycerol glycerophosphotransferase family protein n=1 Tax=Pseudobutyrivibrio ruminis TaxID=46206 RepID=UPI00051B6CBE|nr:CDP-glycerol glycerophosphotransferase family protein [Pseudobutyrivibrio ruminis]